MRKNNLDVPKPAISRLSCAIYTRKSTEEGLDQEFNSLDAHRSANRLIQPKLLDVILLLFELSEMAFLILDQPLKELFRPGVLVRAAVQRRLIVIPSASLFHRHCLCEHLCRLRDLFHGLRGSHVDIALEKEDPVRQGFHMSHFLNRRPFGGNLGYGNRFAILAQIACKGYSLATCFREVSEILIGNFEDFCFADKNVFAPSLNTGGQIGRASCRERV